MRACGADQHGTNTSLLSFGQAWSTTPARMIVIPCPAGNSPPGETARRRANFRRRRTAKLSSTGGTIRLAPTKASVPPVSAAAPGSASRGVTPPADTSPQLVPRAARHCENPRPARRVAPATAPRRANPRAACHCSSSPAAPPNDQAQRHRGQGGALKLAKTRRAPGVGCSAWFGSSCPWPHPRNASASPPGANPCSEHAHRCRSSRRACTGAEDVARTPSRRTPPLAAPCGPASRLPTAFS